MSPGRQPKDRRDHTGVSGGDALPQQENGEAMTPAGLRNEAEESHSSLLDLIRPSTKPLEIDDVIANLSKDERREMLLRLTRSLDDSAFQAMSHDDRIHMVSKLLPRSPANALVREQTSVPVVTDALSTFKKYADAVQNVMVPRISQILELLGNKENDEEGGANKKKKKKEKSTPEENERTAREKAALVNVLQDTLSAFDAVLTFEGTSCHIYFAPPTDKSRYSTGRYRIRFAQPERGDYRGKVSFPRELGVKPRPRPVE